MEITNVSSSNITESMSERGEAVVDSNLELTVDEVIEQHIGSFGVAQIIHALLVSIAWVFDAQVIFISIFSDSQPAVRLFGDKAAGKHEAVASSTCGLAPGAWEWVGHKQSSIITEWNLICDQKFLAALPTSLFFIGSLFGSGFYGYLADSSLGRKKTLLLACVLTFATSFAISFSPNIGVYAFLRFANGLFRSGLGSCCLVLATEVVGRKWRRQVGQYGFFFFGLGFISLPLSAYLQKKSWRNLYRIIAFQPLCYAVLLSILPFVLESPRWLLVKGRKREALETLKKFAKFNGKKLPENISLIDVTPATHRMPEKLWKTKWAVKRAVMIMSVGFGCGFVYYGIPLSSENLNFNLYLTAVINSVMEFPAVIVGGLLLGMMNRRPLFSGSSFLAGVLCVVCAVISLCGVMNANSASKYLQVAVEAIAFTAAATAFNVLNIYCVELFPTNVRNFAVSLLRQAFMLGASAAPLLVALGRVNPFMAFMVFAIVSASSGVLSLWLRETRNAPLYETLKQQENLERATTTS